MPVVVPLPLRGARDKGKGAGIWSPAASPAPREAGGSSEGLCMYIALRGTK